MGVPFEALIPYGIMITMFGITGGGLAVVKSVANGGKKHRHGIDKWDKQMMDRDARLTGFVRGQTDMPIAPKGFELSNPWKIEKRYF